MSRGILLVLVVAFSAACNREVEDPRIRANRIADEVLAGDARLWHEEVGSAFVWTACRKGQVVVLTVQGEKHKLLNLLEQAACGRVMNQMAGATLLAKKYNPNLTLDANPDWLYWAAERSGLERPGVEKVATNVNHIDVDGVKVDPSTHLPDPEDPDVTV